MYQKTDKSTMHGESTPHGLKTPHRYPAPQGKTLTDILMNLVRQLYPTGRAWYMKRNGIFYRFHKAINRSFIRLFEDSQLTIDSCFPDNPNFSEDDASLWEYRLGLITNTAVPFADRKAAIYRKMAYPGNVIPRQHLEFIQYQLQQSGFNVFVYENRFFEGGVWVRKTPAEIVAVSLTNTQYGPPSQYGAGLQYGSSGFDVIANLLDPNETYSIGGNSNLYATFFIGGPNLGDMAIIPASREAEFREQVLKLKPAELIAFTFINFT